MSYFSDPRRPTLIGTLTSLVLAIPLVFITVPCAEAQQSPAKPPSESQEITIATRAVAPFVMDEAGKLDGLSIDLWQAIAGELNLRSRLVPYKTLPEMLDQVRTGKAAAAISAISITAERERQMEFSQPMFRSGLSILVPSESTGIDIFSLLFSSTLLKVLGIFLLIVAIPAHLFWLIARGKDDSLPIAHSYFPGIFDALFWCAEAMGGASPGQPRRRLPRLVALIWIYVGVVLITYFTAFTTTALTTQMLRGSINKPSDLAGRRVGVVKGSTSATYVRTLKARTIDYPGIDAAVKSLEAGQTDAIVYDTPVLLYLASKDPLIRVAGSQFRPESYGIAFPIDSPLRRPVNQALLALEENGTYARLYEKWFGRSEGEATD